MIALLTLAVYASFALDFLLFPIPSEASSRALLAERQTRFRPAHLLLYITHIAVLLLWLLPLLAALVLLFSGWAFNVHGWLGWFGILLALGGRAITLLASHTIRTAPPDTLIEHGVFAFSRHPVVLGLHLTLAGLLCTSASVLALLLYPLSLIYFDRKIAIEEQALITRYADSYLGYSARTPRYLQLSALPRLVLPQ